MCERNCRECPTRRFNLNDRISEFVNTRFEDGHANGNVPNSDELSELFEHM